MTNVVRLSPGVLVYTERSPNRSGPGQPSFIMTLPKADGNPFWEAATSAAADRNLS